MLDLLIIQPTPFCNINCSYCYLPDRTNPKRISPETIKKTIDVLFENNLVGEKLTVVFHAGEPLVPGTEFYRQILTALNEKLSISKINVNYSIQTNGTLITHEWCSLIKEFNINIGVSIDGPQSLHDAYRKTRTGKGTFHSVMRGISLLQKNNIPYHGIAVVTAMSLEYPDELFSFFYNNGFYSLGLNIEEAEGVNENPAIFQEHHADAVTTFYDRIFKSYLASDRHLSIREFDSSLNAILREPETIDITELSIYTHQTSPFGILCVDYNGNFSTFSPELIGQNASAYNNFIFGNVHDPTKLKLQKKELLKRVTKEIERGIIMCKKQCQYYSVCGGGAPANKFYENKTFASTETKYCRYHIQVPTNLVLSYLEEKLELKH